MISYVRTDEAGKQVVVIVNFAPVAWEGCVIGGAFSALALVARLGFSASALAFSALAVVLGAFSAALGARLGRGRPTR